jgi:hypothetical protein
MKLINYKCDTCEREVEHMYMESEEIPVKVPCICERDVYMKKWNVKNNGQRAFVLDQPKGSAE